KKKKKLLHIIKAVFFSVFVTTSRRPLILPIPPSNPPSRISKAAPLYRKTTKPNRSITNTNIPAPAIRRTILDGKKGSFFRGFTESLPPAPLPSLFYSLLFLSPSSLAAPDDLA